MKKVKFTFAALALVALTAGASFAGNSMAKSADPGDDCWSNLTDLQNNRPPDVNQAAECNGAEGICCYKQDGIYGHAEM